ncbi:hypothetical protein KY310_01900 [Candidatus Woesearchaeota archaeon]|nr:hypothetical protein [Candidatus Woesearchaeota archaeon]
MEKNEDFNEDEQPQEEFTDPLPGQGEVEPDKDIFGFPEIPAEEVESDAREQEIQHARVIAELRAQDRQDAYALQQTLQRLHKRKKIADMGGNPDYVGLEAQITSVEQQCRISQRRVLQPEMQAEIVRRSLENGLRGKFNRVRQYLGWQIKVPKNIDMEDVYTTVVSQLEQSRRARLAELQAREDEHSETLSGDEGYISKMEEYQGLVRDALAAVEVAEARKSTIDEMLVTLRSERSSLARKVAAKPHNAKLQKEHKDTLSSIRQYEDELKGIVSGLERTYADLEDNDAKFDHYSALANQERALETMSRKGARSAQRDVDDLVMQRESGDSMGRIGATVRTIAHSAAERSKVNSFLKPQSKASGRLLSKVALYVNAGDQKRRNLGGDTAIDDINLEQDLERRDLYTKMRIKYG